MLTGHSGDVSGVPTTREKRVGRMNRKDRKLMLLRRARVLCNHRFSKLTLNTTALMHLGYVTGHPAWNLDGSFHQQFAGPAVNRQRGRGAEYLPVEEGPSLLGDCP